MMLIPSTITQAGANLDIQVTPGMLVFGGAAAATTKRAFRSMASTPVRRSTARACRATWSTSATRRKSRRRRPVVLAKRKSAARRSASCRRPAATDQRQLLSVERHQGNGGDNYSPSLQARAHDAGKLFKLWDSNLGIGGPIAKD
jgi:hypothetical protein